VGSGSGCYVTVAAALAVAGNGDTISIGPGTFAGGFTITKSVTVTGAGADKTVITGGGPVVTIGDATATTEPTVSISGVTITGGVNDLTSRPGYYGGGVYVVLNPLFSLSAEPVVAITDSVIANNQVNLRQGDACGRFPTVVCDRGGGIANFGAITLVNTTVSDNRASWNATPSAATDNEAAGGGIFNGGVGTLTLKSSTVTGNTVEFDVSTAGPTSDLAHGGGIANAGGSATLENSTVSGNSVRFQTSVPLPDMFAGGGGIDTGLTVDIRSNRDKGGPLTATGSTISGNNVVLTSTNTAPNQAIGAVGGGVHISDVATATITSSQISANTVAGTADGGFVGPGAGGVDDDGTLSLVNSKVTDNTATGTVTSSQTTAGSLSDAGGMEVDGSATIKGTTFSGNKAVAAGTAALYSPGTASTPPTGTIALGGALAVDGGSTPPATVKISGSTFTGNSSQATATTGAALTGGGAIANSSALTLRATSVTGNSSAARGGSGSARGGGLWNSDPGGSPSSLTLWASSIVHNSAAASSGVSVQGQDLYTDSANGAKARACKMVKKSVKGQTKKIKTVQSCRKLTSS
jgi:hypothetical protein